MFRTLLGTKRLCVASTPQALSDSLSKHQSGHVSNQSLIDPEHNGAEKRTAHQARFIQQLTFKKKEHRALKRMAQGLGLLSAPKDRELAREMEEAFVPITVLEKRREKREMLQQRVDAMMAVSESSTQTQFGKGFRKKKLVTPEMFGAELGQSGMDDPRLNGGGKGSWNDFKSRNSRSVPLVHPKLAPGFYSQEFDCWYNFSEEDLRESSCRGQGPGGQATNRRMQTCVLFHLPSRIQVKYHKHRSLHDNRKGARRVLNFKVENWLMGDESREAEILKQWADEKKLGDAREKEDRKRLDEHEKSQWWKFRDFLEGTGVLSALALNREGPGALDPLQETHFKQLQDSIEGPKLELTRQDFLNQLSPACWWRMLCSGNSAQRAAVIDESEGAATSLTLGSSFSPLAFTPVWFSYLFPCSKRPIDASCCPDGMIQLLKARFENKRPINDRPVTAVSQEKVLKEDDACKEVASLDKTNSMMNYIPEEKEDWRRRHLEEVLRELDQVTSVALEAEISRCRESPAAQSAVRNFLPLFLEMFGLRLSTKLVESLKCPSAGELKDSKKPQGREQSKKKRILKRIVVKKRKLSSEKPESSSETVQPTQNLKPLLVIELDGLLWLEQRGRLMRTNSTRSQLTSSSSLAEPKTEPDPLVVGLFAHVLCCLDDMGLDKEYEAMRAFLYSNSSLGDDEGSSNPAGVRGDAILADRRVPGGIRLPSWPRDFSDCVHMTLLAEERSGLFPDIEDSPG